MSGWAEKRRLDLSKAAMVVLFLLCALPVTLLTAFITPPGQSPDEPAHLARADGLLHGAVLGVRQDAPDPASGRIQHMTGVMVDADLFSAAFGNTTPIANRPVVTSADFIAMHARTASPDRVFANLPNTITYFPATYLPATLGLGVAKLFHATPMDAFTTARLFMAIAFLALGGLALWVAAFGEALLFTVLVLPMTLFLAGTVNQDGVLIALTCLACACLTRGTHGGRLAGLVLFALVLLAKPPYVMLLGAFTLPLLGRDFWWRVRDAAVAALPAVIWVVILSALVVVPFGKPPYHPGPLYVGDHSVWFYGTDASANLHILLAQPSRFITLPWDTTVMWAQAKLHETIGVLGALQIVLSDGMYTAWCWAFGIALLGAVFSPRPGWSTAGQGAGNFIVMALLITGTWWLMLITFYLDWSNVGLDFIDGTQGRYVLPLLPFFLFGLPGLGGRLSVPPLLAAAPAALLGLADIAYIPMKLVWTYYLH